MALIPIKSKQDLIREMINYISSRYPNADLSPGLVLRDLLIEAPMNFIGDTIILTNFIEYVINLNTLAELISTPSIRAEFAAKFNLDQATFDNIINKILDLYASNYNMSRKQGSAATGVLTFYSIERPTSTITIPAGTKCRVPNTGIVFQTVKDVMLDGTNLDFNLHYDTYNNRWFVRTLAVSTLTGSIGNVPANSITQLDDPTIPLLVTNDEKFSGGTDVEDDISFLNRIKLAYTGNFHGTAHSILSKVLSFSSVKDAKIAYLPNDPAKERDGLNKIDCFVYSNALANLVSNINITQSEFFKLPVSYVTSINSLKIPQNSGSPYIVPKIGYSASYSSSEDSYVFFDYISGPYIELYNSNNSWSLKLNLSGKTNNPIYGTFPDFVNSQPLHVAGRLQVYINSGTGWINNTSVWKYKLEGNIQTLNADPNMLPFDAKNPPIVAIKILPKFGDSVIVDYYYDSAISLISNSLLNPAVLFVGQDLAFFPAIPVGIIADITVQVDPAYGITDREALVFKRVVELINSYGLNQELNQSFFVSEILKIPGIVDVELPFKVFTRNMDTRTGSSDILLGVKEYPTVFNASDIKITGTYTPIGL